MKNQHEAGAPPDNPRQPWAIRAWTRCRGVVYPCLPALVLLVALASVTRLLDAICRTASGSYLYNDLTLWLATRHGARMNLSIVGLSLALVVVSAIHRHQRSFGQRGARAWLVCIAWTSLVLAAGAFIVWPWFLAAFSPWVVWPLVLSLLWVWLHATWAYWSPLFNPVRRSIRTYWQRLQGPSAYLELLRKLRWTQQRPMVPPPLPRAFVRAAAGPEAPCNHSANSRWERWFQCVVRLYDLGPRPIRQLLARCVPRVPASLASADEILVGELRYLVDLTWCEIEETLYADTADEGDDAMQSHPLASSREHAWRDAQSQFRQWERLADALVECHLFDALSLAPPSGDSTRPSERREEERVRFDVGQAAELMAEYSRRWCLPILRARPLAAGRGATDGIGTSVCWWSTEPLSEAPSGASVHETARTEIRRAFHRADELVEREIETLNWLVGGAAGDRDNVETLLHAYRELRREHESRSANAPRANARSLLTLRLLLARLVRQGIRAVTHEEGTLPPQPVPNGVWAELRDLLETDIRPLIFNSACGDPLSRQLAWSIRKRYFDACLISPNAQHRDLRREIEECQSAWEQMRSVGQGRRALRPGLDQPPDERLEQWYAGQSSLHEAWNERLPRDHRVDAARRAITAFRASGLYCSRKAAETLGRELRDEAVVEVSIATVDPRPTEPRYHSRQVHGAWEDPRGRSRPPNIFVRARLAPVWAGLGLVAALVLWLTAAGSIVPAPDRRLGGRHLHENVESLAPGIETHEPSVWVSTATGGVHVKGGGDDHYWFQLTAENTRRDDHPGLLSNHVRRVDIGGAPPMVSYFCQRQDRKVLVLSDYPQGTPGAWPWLRPGRWATFLGDSHFAQTSDADVSAILQPPGCPLMLFGTHDHGLGRYHVGERRWLDRIEPREGPSREITINAANGFLLGSQRTIQHLDAMRQGSEWLAWLATNDGLAGGPIWSHHGGEHPEADLGPERWTRIAGERLMDRDVRQVQLRSSTDGMVIDYRTAGEGLGGVVQAEGAATAFVVRVGQHGVEDLDERNMQRAAYAKGTDEKRIWVVDAPAAGDTHRVSVYRERTHEWATARPPNGRRVFDIQPDPLAPSHVILGSNHGVQSLVDRGDHAELQLRDHGLAGASVQQVVATPKQVLVRAQRTNDEHPGLYVLPRGTDGQLPLAATAEWQTWIGPRRFDQPSLSLADLTIVEPSTNGRDLYFGTRRWGAGRIDRTTREVYRIGPRDPSVERPVLDLCVIPDDSSGGDRFLLQVTDDHAIQRIDLRDGTAQPIWNHTASGVQWPLVDAAVYDRALYIGDLNHVARYRMDQHVWTPVEPLAGLQRLMDSEHEGTRGTASPRRLWAYTTEEGGALRVLSTDEARPSWSKPLLAHVTAVDPGPRHLVAATHSSQLVLVRPDGQHQFILSPRRLLDHARRPSNDYREVSHAVVGRADDDDALYVAFGSQLAHFDLGSQRWTKLARTVDSPPEELFANNSGLWILNKSRELSVLRNNVETTRATAVRAAAWGTEEAIALHDDGTVGWLAPASPDEATLVGPAWESGNEVATATRVVCGFDSDLFVAAGRRLGQYEFRSHAWHDVTPPGNEPVDQVVATASRLYARDVGGTLFLWTPEHRQWQTLNETLENAARATGANFASPRTTLVKWIGAVAGGLAVVVPDRGTFLLSDATPRQPQWLLAQSQGPAPDALVDCAAELGDDLAVGIRGDGLWIYARIADAAIGSKVPVHAWQRVFNGIVEQIVPVPDDPRHAAIRTQRGLFLLARQNGEPWRAMRQISPTVPHDVAATRHGLYWIAADQADSPTHLIWLPTPFTGEPTSLVGDGAPLDSSTSSVAVDPRTGDLIRADAQGRVARYELAVHRWSPEVASPNRPEDLELFVMGKSVWAWSASDKGLYRRGEERTWAPFQHEDAALKPLRVVHDARGIAVLEAGGRLLHIDERDVVRELLSPTVQTDGRGWRDGCLAELGDWLVVSTRDHTLAYHRQRHAWQRLLDEAADDCDVEESADGARRVYLRGSGQIWDVSEQRGELSARKITLTSGAADHARGSPPSTPLSPSTPWSGVVITGVLLLIVVAVSVVFVWRRRRSDSSRQRTLCVGALVLVAVVALACLYEGWRRHQQSQPAGPIILRDNSRILSVQADGSIHELKSGQLIDPPLVRPVPLQMPELPRIAAAAEWNERLFLAHTSSAVGRLSVYDPRRLRWHSFALASRSIVRFWPTPTELFAECQDGETSATPNRSLVRIVAAGPDGWRCQDVANSIQDVTSDGKHVWFIDSADHIQTCRVNGLFEQTAALGVGFLPASIRAAVPHGREVVTLLDDGTLWSYSLDNLTWQRGHKNSGFRDLFVSQSNLVALETSDDGHKRTYWHYVGESSNGEGWIPLQQDDTGAFSFPTEARDAHPDQWQVTSKGRTRIIRWRPGANGEFFEVGRIESEHEPGRLDFDRFARIGWAGGALWCETKARRGAAAVVRRFTVKAGRFDKEVGAPAMESTADAAESDTRFSKLSRWQVDGIWFKAVEDEQGAWPTTEKNQNLRFTLNKMGTVGAAVKLTKKQDAWQLDVDDWRQVVAHAGLLHAATRAGILTVQTEADGCLRRVAFQPCPDPVQLVVREDRVLARGGDRCCYRFHSDQTWKKEVDQAKANQEFERATSVLRSNRHLKNWRVTRSSDFELQMRVDEVGANAQEDFVPVTLGERGFGFDHAAAVSLDADSVWLYGPDGRVRLPRNQGPGAVAKLETQFRWMLERSEPGARRVLHDEATTAPTLLGEHNAYEFRSDAWHKLEDTRAATLRDHLRRTTVAGQGWTWNRDDEVTLAAAPFTPSRPFKARFDARAGQFSFDRLRALHGDREHLWCASDAGVMKWHQERLTDGDATTRLGSPDAPQVRFFTVDGRRYLHRPARAAAFGQLFEASPDWELVADERTARLTLAQRQRQVLGGDHWRITRPEHSTADIGSRFAELIITRNLEARFPRHHWLDARCWDFELVTCACSTSDRTLCGTTTGLLDLLESRYVPFDEGIRRLTWERDRLHAFTAQGRDTWLSLDGTPQAPAAPIPFSQLDRTLYEDARWRWERPDTGPVNIHVQLAPGQPMRRTEFSGGRFDFDRVRSVAVDAGHALLATDAGVLLRATPHDGSATPVPANELPSLSSPCFFQLWWEGSRRLFVSSHCQNGRPTGEIFQRDARWTQLPRERAAQVIDLFATQESRNDRWIVSRPVTTSRSSTEPQFQIVLPQQPPQPVQFDPDHGTFSIGVVNSVALTPDGKRLDVATAGGLVRYELNGKLAAIYSDVRGNATPTPAKNLWRTKLGTLAELDQGFLLWSESGWRPLDADEARRHIDASHRWIAQSADGWAIERTGSSSPDKAFRWHHAGEPLALTEISPRGHVNDHPSLAFAHDQATSAEWDQGSVWIATMGGCLELTWRNDELVVPKTAPQLWTTPFANSQPYLIRKPIGAAATRTSDCVCRAWRDGAEFTLALTRSSAGTKWAPIAASDEFTILHPNDGLWEWRLPTAGRVAVEPDRSAFAASSLKDDEWFHEGQIAFWHTGEFQPQETDRLAVADGVFVAATGGVLRLAASADNSDRVDVLQDSDGRSLAVRELGVNPFGQLFARTNRGTWEFHSARDEWSPTSQPFPGRDQPVQCGWVTFEHRPKSGVFPRLSPQLPGADSRPTSALLSQGRFSFDRVKSFVWVAAEARDSAGSYWLLTSLGLVQMDAEGGTLRQWASNAPFDPGSVASLHNREGTLYVTDDHGRAWQRLSDGSWTEDVPPSHSWRKLRTVADNMLLTSCQTGPRKFEYSFGGFPNDLREWFEQQPNRRLLHNGVFLFDDLRDVRQCGDRLLVATRAGVWEYPWEQLLPLIDESRRGDTDVRMARRPAAAALLARVADDRLTPEPVAMDDVTQFVNQPDLRLFAASRAIEFRRHDVGIWRPQRRESVVKPAERIFEDEVDPTKWHVSVANADGAGTLTVTRTNEGLKRASKSYPFPNSSPAVADLSSAFATRDAIWIPQRNGLLWVRKSRFPD